MKSDLLKYCRFYKGEASCPFKDGRASLWSAERSWVKMAEAADPLLDEYLEALQLELPDMVNEKGAHPSLKALLLDRYTHFGGTPEGFRRWFARSYGD